MLKKCININYIELYNTVTCCKVQQLTCILKIQFDYYQQEKCFKN